MISVAFTAFICCSIVTVSQCGLETDSECSANRACPVWMPTNAAANRTCKSDHGKTVRCVRGENGDYHLSLLPCYCVTQYGNYSYAVVGLCQYTCTERLPLLNYVSLPPNVTLLSLSDAV